MAVSKEELRQQLKVEQKQLIDELEQLQITSRQSLGYSTHMADDASAAFDQARDLALQNNLKRQLQEVKEALERLDNGAYGVCETCGQSIDPARLKALPQAARCLDCQRRLEH